MALVGPNGVGKSTLLQIISHTEKADYGKMRIKGRDNSDRAIFEDLSAIGSLRSVLNGSAYVALLFLAVWIGDRGKAVEVAGNRWPLYQTQPVDLRLLLVTKWLMGLGLSLGFTLLFLTGVWLVNSLIGG